MNSLIATLDLISHSADCTYRLGQRLGRRLVGGDVVLLSGGLGAGKTTFTQGIAAALGVVGSVSSPTFTLINEYAATSEQQAVTLYHIDLYRLSEGGVETLGLDDYFGSPDGITVVEWPQVAPEALPASALVVSFAALDETKRRLRFQAQGPQADHYQRQISSLQQELFGVTPR